MLQRTPALLVAGALVIASAALVNGCSGVPGPDASDAAVETRISAPVIVTEVAPGRSVPILGLQCTVPAGWRAWTRVPDPRAIREMSADLECSLEPDMRAFWVEISAFPPSGSQDATGFFESSSNYRRIAVPKSVGALSDAGAPEVAQYKDLAMIARVPRRVGLLEIVVRVNSNEPTTTAQLAAYLNQAASMFRE